MMNKYTGTKEVLAKSMSRLEYNSYRGWQTPDDEDGSDDGYLVEYLDGGQANHKSHLGYVSWSPKDVFERAYKPSQTPLERVITERAELVEKIDKLDSFIDSITFVDLGVEHGGLMNEQIRAMDRYADILDRRIGLMREGEK